MKKGVGEGRTGISRYRGMKNNKVLLKSIRKYIKYPVINCLKKNKNIYIYVYIYIFMCITESHCCAAQHNATLKISHISI